MTSPIYAARQWLHDQLVASADLSGVQVTYGAPWAHQSNEVVALGGVTSVNEEDRIFGGGRVDREFVLTVWYGAFTGGTSSDAAEWVDQRGFELHEAIRSVVMGDRTLGATVRQSIAEGLDTDGAVPIEDPDRGTGWFHAGAVNVRCEVRTT